MLLMRSIGTPPKRARSVSLTAICLLAHYSATTWCAPSTFVSIAEGKARMKRNVRRSLSFAGLLVAVALGIGLWPRSTSAVRATVSLADTNQSFGAGRFVRTGLAAATAQLNGGGVQLVPVNIDDVWPRDQDLPIPLSAQTSVGYHDRLFVVGGYTTDASNNVLKSKKFYSTRLSNPDTGVLEPWNNQPTLPDLPIAVTDAASLVVEVNEQPFLMVLGGLKSFGTLDDVTTSRIFYYPIRTDGSQHLINTATWTEIPDVQRLPYETFLSEDPVDTRGGGARGLSAIAVSVQGTSYIYIFGGNNRVFTGNKYIDRYDSGVWRTPVRLVNNQLQLGPVGCASMAECWEHVGDITNTADSHMIPLANAASALSYDPITNSTALYLVGGIRCTNTTTTATSCQGDSTPPDTTPDSNAYIAKISSTGGLSWLETGNLSEPRNAHDAVQSKGRIIVAAGRASGDPTTTLATGFVEDDLTLYRSAPSAPNFDLSQGALQGAQPRMNHSMEVISAGTHEWAYMIGGKVKTSARITDASVDVLLGDMDKEPTPSDSFVVDGKYYSKVYDFGQDAEYFTLYWKAVLATGQYIQMQYRVGNDPQNLSPLSPSTGSPVGAPSVNGMNSLSFPANTKYRYIQFVATLGRQPGSSPTLSPVLDSVSLDVNRKGFPNARVNGASGFSISPATINFNSTIAANLSLTNQAFDSLNPALPADWDAPGTFFVDLYAFYWADNTSVPTPPIFGQTNSQAYVEVNKANMGVNATYNVAPSAWRPSSCNVPPCQPVNWSSIFNQQGKYAVYVMVDSLDPASYNAGSQQEKDFGNLKEADAANTIGETDNIFGPFTVTVLSARRTLYLPTVLQNGAAPATAPSALPPARPRVHTLDGSR